ncbi:hypothetical protein [Pseudomonas sp. 5P_3.1_Bac2]|uniref:hypothetical protein n=1 Tax=Pseudomonas sp. 5P_3.1_Bac2 TaxID=2971617 RepID=UPI0021C7982C|nr:hypothetical protein [Pseudomonas sp. 5P_3.1_Bac2]MCU1719228.1 hypothetical protein [Pseudomonas sp. 5P_3.1_Bac2]
MQSNSALPVLPPTFLALTPPRRMCPGFPMPRFELPRSQAQGLAAQRASQQR